MASGAELFEALATEIAHRIHRGLEEFARIKLVLVRCGHLAERGCHREAAVGVDIDLADTMPDAADDLVNRHAPGLRHLATEFIEHVLQRLRY